MLHLLLLFTNICLSNCSNVREHPGSSTARHPSRGGTPSPKAACRQTVVIPAWSPSYRRPLTSAGILTSTQSLLAEHGIVQALGARQGRWRPIRGAGGPSGALEAGSLRRHQGRRTAFPSQSLHVPQTRRSIIQSQQPQTTPKPSNGLLDTSSIHLFLSRG